MAVKRVCCQHCSYPIAKDAKTCPHCGSLSPIAPEPWQKKALEKTWIIVREVFYWLLGFSIIWYVSKEIVCKIW